MNLSHAELKFLESTGNQCDDWSEGDECTTGMNQRGDLLLCDKHAKKYPWNVGRVEGEVRCSCGFFKPIGAECGEPCM